MFRAYTHATDTQPHTGMASSFQTDKYTKKTLYIIFFTPHAGGMTHAAGVVTPHERQRYVVTEESVHPHPHAGGMTHAVGVVTPHERSTKSHASGMPEAGVAHSHHMALRLCGDTHTLCGILSPTGVEPPPCRRHEPRRRRSSTT